MKMKKEQMEELERRIDQWLEEREIYLPYHYNLYKDAGLSFRRFIFDISYAAGLTPYICDQIYPAGMTDDHLFTALKKIINKKL